MDRLYGGIVVALILTVGAVGGCFVGRQQGRAEAFGLGVHAGQNSWYVAPTPEGCDSGASCEKCGCFGSAFCYEIENGKKTLCLPCEAPCKR